VTCLPISLTSPVRVADDPDFRLRQTAQAVDRERQTAFESERVSKAVSASIAGSKRGRSELWSTGALQRYHRNQRAVTR